MRKISLCTFTIFYLILAGCGTAKTLPLYEESYEEEYNDSDSVDNAPEVENTSDTHKHLPFEGENIVEHEAALYCGNTVTSVRYYSTEESSEDDWNISFWGSDSITLTDLLRYLDYQDNICRCIPEYTVDTEFGEDYYLNLTEGYVRHDDRQASLTTEQVQQIQDIINTAALQIN